MGSCGLRVGALPQRANPGPSPSLATTRSTLQLLVQVVCLALFLETVDEEWAQYRQDQREEADVQAEGALVKEMAPQAWDRRYYRLTATTGLEVLLIRRLEAGKWAVVKPDLTVGALPLSQRKTLASGPVNGVVYTACPVLSKAQKTHLRNEVDQLKTNNQLVDFPLYQPGRNIRNATLLEMFVIGLSAPAKLLRNLRWALRSRWRSAGVVGLCFLFYQLVSWLGIWEMYGSASKYVLGVYVGVRDGYADGAEWLSEWILWVEGWHAWGSGVMPLWKWFCVALSLLVLYSAAWWGTPRAMPVLREVRQAMRPPG